MKSLLKVGAFFTMFTVLLFLTGCTNSQDFDVSLIDGDEIIVETDLTQLTRQDLFEMVSTGSYNASLFEVIDWVDYHVLSAQFDVDYDNLELQMENFLESVGDELDHFLTSRGFHDLSEIKMSFTVDQLRFSAVSSVITIDEEDIEAAYYEWFVSSIPNEDEDEDAEEIHEFEEVRDDIEAFLRNSYLDDHAFRELTLANFRAEAGLTFFSDYFEDRYEEYLNWFNLSMSDLDYSQTSAKPNVTGDVIVAVGDVALTADALFETVLYRTVLVPGFDGSTPALAYLDFVILNETFEGDRDAVRSNINTMKINMLDNFYPTMAMQGLNNDQEIFDHFMRLHLQEIAFMEAFGTPTQAQLQVWEDLYLPDREVKHILVTEEDEAIALIERLEAVDAAEFDEYFAELAAEYSGCGSRAQGGSLGMLGIPSGMIQEFEEAAFNLEVGTFTHEPVETDRGYHIIYVPREGARLEGTRLTNHLTDLHLQHHRNNPAFLSSVLINLREQNNLRFNDPRLQTQYNLIVASNLEAME